MTPCNIHTHTHIHTHRYTHIPINEQPRIGEVGNLLQSDEDFFSNVDGAQHLLQVLAGVGKELLHLHVVLQTVELQDLGRVEGRGGEDRIGVGRIGEGTGGEDRGEERGKDGRRGEGREKGRRGEESGGREGEET